MSVAVGIGLTNECNSAGTRGYIRFVRPMPTVTDTLTPPHYLLGHNTF